MIILIALLLFTAPSLCLSHHLHTYSFEDDPHELKNAQTEVTKFSSLRMILLFALLLDCCFSLASALLLDGKVGGFEQYLVKLESLQKLGDGDSTVELLVI